MNITFLIGNGFDLNLGLKTKYTDFLSVYKHILQEDVDCVEYFKKYILKNEDLWVNVESAFGIATEQFKIDKHTAEEYCTCHEDFCLKLAEYLIEQEQQLNYTDLNPYLVKGFSNGILNYKKGFRELEQSQLVSAENNVGGGLIFNFVNFNYTQTLDMCISAVREKNSILGQRTHNRTTFDNHIGKVLHVHGTVHRDMVLGVNDVSQISDLSLFNGYDDEYINEVIKQKTNEINEENTDEKVFELLKSSDLIYVYGMSTGITDKLWWERICQLMNKNSNLQLIIHKFDAPEDGLIRRSFRVYTKKVKKDFTAYCNLEENAKSDIASRIHIDRTNIFDGLEGLVNNTVNTANKELLLV